MVDIQSVASLGIFSSLLPVPNQGFDTQTSERTILCFPIRVFGSLRTLKVAYLITEEESMFCACWGILTEMMGPG